MQPFFTLQKLEDTIVPKRFDPYTIMKINNGNNIYPRYFSPKKGKIGSQRLMNC